MPLVCRFGCQSLLGPFQIPILLAQKLEFIFRSYSFRFFSWLLFSASIYRYYSLNISGATKNISPSPEKWGQHTFFTF